MRLFFALLVLLYFPMTTAMCAAVDELRTWIDSETGHRVMQIAPEPYAMLPYFSSNAVSADKKSMAYMSGRGLHLIDLTTMSTQLLVPDRRAALQFIGMGRKQNRAYYVSRAAGQDQARILSIDIASRQVTEHARVPTTHRIESLSADDTLVAGIVEDKPANTAARLSPNAKRGNILYARHQEKIPMTLFTVDLRTGATRAVYQSTEWLSHVQFSPADPSLLMYSLEGPWHLVDRIWTIRTDGSARTLIHARTLDMEIAGHEFWSEDGRYIHYDWQYPKGKVFYLASHELATGQRTATALDAEQWSIHFNASSDPALFAGDGADRGQVSRSRNSAYIYLYRRPLPAPAADTAAASRIIAEKLVDLGGHDYRLEPNARLSPDNKWIVFRSNMFGTPSIFAVATAKNTDPHLRVESTQALSHSYRAAREAYLLPQ